MLSALFISSEPYYLFENQLNMVQSDIGEVMLQSTLYTKQFKFVFFNAKLLFDEFIWYPRIFRREENVLGF